MDINLSKFAFFKNGKRVSFNGKNLDTSTSTSTSTKKRKLDASQVKKRKKEKRRT